MADIVLRKIRDGQRVSLPGIPIAIRRCEKDEDDGVSMFCAFETPEGALFYVQTGDPGMRFFTL